MNIEQHIQNIVAATESAKLSWQEHTAVKNSIEEISKILMDYKNMKLKGSEEKKS